MSYFKSLMKAINGDLAPEVVAKTLNMDMDSFQAAVLRHCNAKKLQIPEWVSVDKTETKASKSEAKPETAGLINRGGQNVIAGTPRASMAAIPLDWDEIVSRAAAKANAAEKREARSVAERIKKEEAIAFFNALKEADARAARIEAERAAKKAAELEARRQQEIKKAATVAVAEMIVAFGQWLKRAVIATEERRATARRTEAVQKRWAENVDRMMENAKAKAEARIIEKMAERMLAARRRQDNEAATAAFIARHVEVANNGDFASKLAKAVKK